MKPEEILREVVVLPASDRAALALRILETLDDRPVDADAEEVWTAEIHRRLEALLSGRARTVGADDALAWVEARLRSTKPR